MAPAVSAGVISVGTWREADTTMDRVLSALTRLRRADQRGAVRASSLTLVAVGGEQIEVDDTFDTVHRLGVLQPTRVVVVRVVGRDRHRLDARVGVHLQERGERCLSIDDVALEVGGPVTDHLDSVVEPLTLSDLPIVMWCRERLPPARSRLIDLADHLVVDTARAGGASRLAALERLRARVPVTDLAWLRLFPLRRRVAEAVRGRELLARLDDVRSATAHGPGPEGVLLASWLRCALPGTPVDHDEGDGDDEAAPLSVALAGADWRLEVRHQGGCLSCRVELEGQAPRAMAATAPSLQTETLLGHVLLHLRPDPVYDRSLSAAAAQAG